MSSPFDRLPHRFLERAVEPAVAEHVLDGDGGILQVFERVHQDKVQNDVIEVQVFHLGQTWTLALFILPWCSLCCCVTESDVVDLPLVWPALSRCFPSGPCSQGSRSSPQRLPRTGLGSEKHTASVRTAVNDYGSLHRQLGLQSYLVCFHHDGRQNLLSRFSQKHSGCSLTQEELRT